MSSLEVFLSGILPSALQELSASHHLERSQPEASTSASPSRQLTAQLQRFSYGFAQDERWRRSMFGEGVALPWEDSDVRAGKRPQRQRDAAASSSVQGLQQQQPDSIDNDDASNDELLDEWTLSGAQARADRDSGGLPSEYSRTRKGKPCGHVFKRGESVYRCKECSLDDSCVLCAKCFKASNHEGHEVSFSMHAGGCGCCDCGDHEAWRREIDCAYHHPDTPYPAELLASTSGSPTERESAPASAQPKAIPAELQHLLRQHIEETVSLILRAVAQFPRDTTAPSAPRVIGGTQHTCPLPRATPEEGSPSHGPWSVILWNDEKHTYDQVIDQLVSSTRCSRSQARASAVRVDSYGLEVVATSTDTTRLWKVAHIISRIDLGVTVCTSQDAIVLYAVGYLLDWLGDLAKVKVGGDETFMGRLIAQILVQDGRLATLLTHEDKLWKRARTALRHLLMSLLVVGHDVKLELGRQYAAVYPSLVSAYLLNDREPENSITLFSVQLFSAPSIATELVTKHNFLSTVVKVLYSFFTQQHYPAGGVSDPEASVQKYIQYPPSANHPPVDPDSSSFKHKRYVAVFQELNHLLSHAGVRAHVVSQTDDTLTWILEFLHLFAEMNPHVRASAVHVEYETDSWVSAFNLTIQLAKLARLAGAAFNPSAPLKSVAGIGSSSAAALVPPASFAAAIAQMVQKMAALAPGATEEETSSQILHNVNFAGKKWQVVSYRVSEEPVSFHHPIHLIYSELLKNLDAWTDDSIASATNARYPSFAALVTQQDTRGSVVYLRIVDEVVRVLAMLAQIRAGLWVRNGFGIRAQGLHYREYNLRENTFDQDVFFLQAAFITLDPSLLLVTLLDRFQVLETLLNPIATETRAPFADFGQARTVVEELLYLLVVVFSEPCDIEAFTIDQVVERELVHTLLLNPLSYTEIVKAVTDRVEDESSFERILTQVADFRAPDPTKVTSDVGGVYTLKKAYYSSVDPYYYRYTRNQREDAFKILQAHFDNGGVPVSRKLQLKGPFAQVADSRPAFADILTLPVFISIIRLAVRFAVRPAPASDAAFEIADTVVDLVIRLVNIALVERPEAFCNQLAEDDENPGGSLAKYLVMLEKEDAAKEHRAKISHVLDSIAAIRPGPVLRWRGQAAQAARAGQTGAFGSEQEDVPASATLAEQKKAAAKARQAAIMQQFSAQQQAFLDANLSDDDDEDDDEDDDDVSLMLAVNKAVGATRDLDMEKSDHAEADASTATIMQEEQKTKRKRKAANSLGSCIVCQEELTASTPFGSLALVQTSSFIRLSPTGAGLLQQEVLEMPTDLDKNADPNRPFGVAGRETGEKEGRGGTSHGFPRHTRKGLFASACGHSMHVLCFETYCASIQQRHTTQITRNHPENPERKEFICPLCKSLGNILLPLSDDDFENDLPLPASSSGSGIPDDWLNSVLQSVSYANPDLKNALHLLTRGGSGEVRAWRINDSLPTNPATFGFASISQDERKLLERLLSVVAPLDAESRMLSSATVPGQTHTLPHELISYTLASIEIALRGKETGTLCVDSIPEATAKLLRSLLAALDRLVVLSTGTPRGTDFARLALLWTMFGDRSAYPMSPFLSRDPLTVLIECVAVDPAGFHHFATLTFYAHVLRTSQQLYQEGYTVNETGSLQQHATPDQAALVDFCVMLQEERWRRTGEHVTDGMMRRARSAFQLAYTHILPFLRRAAILYNVVYSPPRSLVGEVGEDNDDSELTRLLDLLRIPHPKELTGRKHGKAPQRTTSLTSILDAWDVDWLRPSPIDLQIQALHRQKGLHPVTEYTPESSAQLEHPVIYELLGLPKHIDILIESSVNRRCKKCRTVPINPAICLLCGELVCQQAYCCMDQDLGDEPEHGECNMHMWECGVSTGIFLLVKKCTIVYLYADKGTYAVAPYLDSHGEADFGFRKHRPLFLNQARYDEIRKLWLNHSIATVVARKLDAGNDPGGWGTL